MRYMAFVLVAVFALGAHAEVATETVEYKYGEVVLKGYAAYDDAVTGKRPGVLVVHEWWGLNAYAKRRAEQLARLGYVAFAADMYGAGKVAKDRGEASALAGGVRKGLRLMRDRARAGLEVLRERPLCDSKRVAAIGYCFGGGVALELARDGAEIAGVVSFHGSLGTADPEDAKNMKAKVLVCHGADDPHVPMEQVIAFQEEMRNAGVDWQTVSYGGAVHAFTNPDSGDDPTAGSAYNAKADRRSWEAMKDFFAEIFGEVQVPGSM